MDLRAVYMLVAIASSTLAVVVRPRGVSISMAPLYEYKEADPSFYCLDKSNKVPYDYINDDYCDCADGSDEPGTSACPNGKYHCTNAGHTPLNINSSRVNDGICDCCDGSDEYEEIIHCTNNCKELGKLAREEFERVKRLAEEGYKLRLVYSEDGKKAVEEKQSKAAELEKLLGDAKTVRETAEAKKLESEAPEKEAKDAHEKQWNEEKERRQKEADLVRCTEAFNELDINRDGLVDVQEMILHPEFDIDNNGVVSTEEATEYMADIAEANMDHFTEKMWAGMKDIYKVLAKKEPNVVPEDEAPPTASPEKVPEPPGEKSDVGDDKEDVKRDADDDDEDDYKDDPEDEGEVNDRAEGGEEDEYKEPDDVTPPPDVKGEQKDEKRDDDMPEYDDNTKALIQAADESRAEYNKADEEVKRIEKEISEIKEFLNLDLGPDREFYPLRGECYELEEKEYKYILCPFSKASQRSKSGGSETSLGTWGHWDGPDNDRFSAMKYEHGQNCWNGPDRSVKVFLACGLENKLTSASEPSRCEYHFTFTTPSRCTKSTDTPPHHEPHMEL